MVKEPEDSTQPLAIASSLEACILALETPAAGATLGAVCPRPDGTIIDGALAQGSGSAVWKLTLELIRSLSDVLTSSLPNFWKIAKDYMEGKFKKVRLCPTFAPFVLT
jgi:exocyst complex component 2